jgi:hypothetical protein
MRRCVLFGAISVALLCGCHATPKIPPTPTPTTNWTFTWLYDFAKDQPDSFEIGYIDSVGQLHPLRSVPPASSPLSAIVPKSAAPIDIANFYVVSIENGIRATPCAYTLSSQ